MLARIIIAAIFLLFAGRASYAQSQPVYQTGHITPGHAARWANPGIVQDAGGALSGNIKSLGIVQGELGPLPPFCINDTFVSNENGYHQLCVSAADAFGDGGQLTYNPIGGVTNEPLTMRVANKLILTSAVQQIAFQNLPQTVSGDVPVCINPATGQLFQASSSDRYVMLTDDANSVYLTDDSSANYLAAFIPAGSCAQQ